MVQTLTDALIADPLLLGPIIASVESALTMCDTVARCVGVATVPGRDAGSITGMIGVHGEVSGFITVNMAQQVALSMVGRLLQDRCDVLSGQVIDGVGEIANMIAGGIKKGVVGTPWRFTHLTVPSVIIGQNYQIAFARGLKYLCVTFEHENEEALLLEDRLIQVAISLLRL
jgi:chemotaxis protein CheX